MRFVHFFLLLTALSSISLGDDWPQWMGPNRDNRWQEEGIIKAFPKGGPKVLWSIPVAGGYSGVAVSGGRVIITDYVTADNVKVPNFERKKFSGTERVLCVDEKTGKEIWTHEYPVNYAISYPAGPRCTPVVHDGKVYTLGAEGTLFCLDFNRGEEIWSVDFQQKYETKAALWGYAGHPLVDSNKLICTVGGKGSHAVAFDLATGDEIWKTLTSPEQGYSPPTVLEASGVRQLLLLRPDAVTSVNPENGKTYWSVPYQATNGLISMSPIKFENYLYVAGYSKKNLLLKLGKEIPTAEVVWQDLTKQAISPVNVQPFLEGDILYGFHERGAMYAVELPSGKRIWETTKPLTDKRAPHSGTAFLVKQADRFWLFTENGDLIIAKLSADGYEEIDRAHVIEPTNVAFGRDVVWCAPAFANRHVYIRNDKECICLDLSEKGN